MRHLSIDIETYSSVDIKKSGLYRYVQSPDFQILLLAYSVDGEPVKIIDLASGGFGSCAPLWLIDAIKKPEYIKHAYNAAFEWYCLSKYFGFTRKQRIDMLPQWRCTMLHGLYCGYTAGLGATGEALGIPQDKRKLGIGNSLIKTFCTPCKPTAANGNRTKTGPFHEPEKWQLFKEYCIQDVAAEMEIENRLSAFPVPDSEQKLWELDQRINDFGVGVDLNLIDGALTVSAISTDELMTEAVKISGLYNPKSVKQLTEWLQEETGDEIDNLKKDTVKEILKGDIESDAARRMLEIRQELSKTSIKKYTAMVSAVCDDKRIRGLTQFYGANRTGRWAGRLVQLQNLPRNYLETLSHARECVKSKKMDAIKFVYGNVPDTLSQLIRTAFIPSEGHTFIVADFSAIEARVIAWLAGEQWVMDVFATHGKIYEATAAQMFGVPIELIKKPNPEYSLRQKGKVATLALGYQGAVGALIAMGALNMGLTEEELPDIVSRWRQANKRIVALWYDVENAALEVMQTGYPAAVRSLTIAHEGDYKTGQDFLTITLPNGRKLFYVKPFLAPNKWGNDSIHYYGMDQETKKWGTVDTWGGKLVENVVQAIARDCLAISMQRLEAQGFHISFHVHDEVILDQYLATDPEDMLKTACEIMGEPIPWAPGLLLKAAGFTTDYYCKD